MPKQKIAATQLLHQRVKKGERMKQSTTIANCMNFQVIGNGTLGNPASVLLRSENHAYLFNCGEGTQRLAHEHKIKFGHLEDIFVTSASWENISGVLGLTLTLQDIGIPRVTLHGPNAVKSLFESTKGFVPITSGMELITRVPNQGDYIDSGITMTYVPLASDVTSLEDDKSEIVAYVGQAPQLPGSLNPQKCIELKIPIGAHLSKLKAGLDIDLPDGRHIKSSDVVGPPKAGPKFVVVECPDLCFMNSITSNPILSSAVCDANLRMVIHFTPDCVFHSRRYQEWMSMISSDCQHMILNDSCNPLNFQAIYRMQNQLSMIDRHIFPTLRPQKSAANNHDQKLSEESDQVQRLKLTGSNILLPDTADKVTLRPDTWFEKSKIANDMETHREEALSMPQFEEHLHQLHPKLDKVQLASSQYPEVVFLGTGSAIPSKVRNTSCILLNMTPDASMIMDSGEGSFGQLHRFYGDLELTEDTLRRIKLIYISHYHADHHLGLIEIIRRRERLTDEPLNLIIPPQVERWLKQYCLQFEDFHHYLSIYQTRTFDALTTEKSVREDEKSIGITSESISDNDNKLDAHSLYKKLPMISNITTTQVVHCAHAYAIVVKLNLGSPNAEPKQYSIAYSGDAIPSDQFVEIGRNCDLLIHEATMEDDLAEEALAKRHSTTSQAIDVGQRMGAKFTLLTHFSQRYAKIPVFNERFHDTVGVAFDNLRLSCPSDLNRLPLLVPALTALFRDHVDMLAMARHRAEMRLLRLSQQQSELKMSEVKE